MKFEHEFEDVLNDITDEYFDPDLFVAAEGNLDANLMLIGEAPGATEAKEGRPFVGRGGDILDDALDTAGIDRSKTYVTNLVKARPPDNRDPYRDEINAWKPLIEKEIEVVNPDGIITLGRIAMYELVETNSKITEVRGERFEDSGYQIYPTYHPAATLYDRDRLGPFQQDIERAVNEVF